MKNIFKYSLFLLIILFLSTSCLTSLMNKAKRDIDFYELLEDSYEKFYDIENTSFLPADKKLVIYDYEKEKKSVDNMVSSGFVAGGGGGLMYTTALFKEQKGESSIRYAAEKLGLEKRAWYSVIYKDLRESSNEFSRYEVVLYYPITEKQKKLTFPGLLLKDMRINERKETEVNSGAYVRTVFSSTYADKSGLKQGDVIVEFADKKISRAKDFFDTLAQIKNKTKVNLVVVRNGERKLLEMEITREEENK